MPAPGTLRVATGNGPLRTEHERLVRGALRRGDADPEDALRGATLKGDYGETTLNIARRAWTERMRREQLNLGGEQSGHIIFGAENFHIGDGLYTSLRVLRVMCDSGRPLSELVAAYRPFPQVLVNVPVTRMPAFDSLPDDSIAAASTEVIFAADATRREAIISNPATNTSTFRIGDAGAAAARRTRDAGHIVAAVLVLRQGTRVVGDIQAAIAA